MNNYNHISFRRRWELDPLTIHKLGRCEALITSLRNIPLLPSVRAHLYKVSLEKGANATTAIEGNSLSEEEVKSVNENTSSLPESKKYLEQEVKNVLDALNDLRNDVVKKGILQDVTPDLIKDFNRRIGKGLSDECFKSDPGVFRTFQVTVGNVYTPPNYKHVEEYVGKLCSWLKNESFAPFSVVKGSMADSIIKAIVAHVYLAWIHPFGDGNGRTARLVEFYILLKSGLPDFCSHILSNHYNETRTAYYDQLKKAGETGDLTNFLSYAITGFLDGLIVIDKKICNELWNVSWQAYIRGKLSEDKANPKIKKRLQTILEGLEMNKEYSLKEILFASSHISHNYADSSSRLLIRDVKKLLDMKLLVSDKPSTYKLNIVAMLTTQDLN